MSASIPSKDVKPPSPEPNGVPSVLQKRILHLSDSDDDDDKSWGPTTTVTTLSAAKPPQPERKASVEPLEPPQELELTLN